MEKLRKEIFKLTSFDDVKKAISPLLKELHDTPCPVPDDSSLNDFDGSYKDWVKAKKKLQEDRNSFQDEIEKSAQKYINILDEWIINFYKKEGLSKEEVEIVFNNAKESYKLFYDLWEKYDAIFYFTGETITLYKNLLKVRRT